MKTTLAFGVSSGFTPKLGSTPKLGFRHSKNQYYGFRFENYVLSPGTSITMHWNHMETRNIPPCVLGVRGITICFMIFSCGFFQSQHCKKIYLFLIINFYFDIYELCYKSIPYLCNKHQNDITWILLSWCISPEITNRVNQVLLK